MSTRVRASPSLFFVSPTAHGCLPPPGLARTPLLDLAPAFWKQTLPAATDTMAVARSSVTTGVTERLPEPVEEVDQVLCPQDGDAVDLEMT